MIFFSLLFLHNFSFSYSFKIIFHLWPQCFMVLLWIFFRFFLSISLVRLVDETLLSPVCLSFCLFFFFSMCHLSQNRMGKLIDVVFFLFFFRFSIGAFVMMYEFINMSDTLDRISSSAAIRFVLTSSVGEWINRLFDGETVVAVP